MKPLAPWLATAACAFAQDGWSLASGDAKWLLDIRPSIETVVWFSDDPAPALLETDDSVFLDPRLRLEADLSYDSRFLLHGTLRADRGFDPGSDEDGDLRLDEILLRWQACDDQRLNIQIGRFPTVFGAWQAGHDFYDDPFLLPPLPYSQIIGVQTRDPAAMAPAAIAARDNGTAPSVSSLAKENWASAIWGPAYGTGAAVLGATERFDYAFEVKNAGLSSHPDSWTGNGFGDPSFAARLGYRPDAAWAFGLSAAQGPWLEDDVAGIDRGDHPQSTLGFDARWAHRDVVLTGELIMTEFDTPAADDLRTVSCFVGGRWKLAPGFWLATRFGWTLADDATDPAGNPVEWQPDVWRAELAAGWRVTSSLLVKAAYAYTHTDDRHDAGEHLLGTGFGWRF
jgi:hypothetical protein